LAHGYSFTHSVFVPESNITDGQPDSLYTPSSPSSLRTYSLNLLCVSVVIGLRQDDILNILHITNTNQYSSSNNPNESNFLYQFILKNNSKLLPRQKQKQNSLLHEPGAVVDVSPTEHDQDCLLSMLIKAIPLLPSNQPKVIALITQECM